MQNTVTRIKIAELRDQANLTQLELSKLVRVTETTIANWEKGRSGLEWIERLIRLCKALNCQPEDLIEQTTVDSAKACELQKPETPPLSELHKLLGTDKQEISYKSKRH